MSAFSREPNRDQQYRVRGRGHGRNFYSSDAPKPLREVEMPHHNKRRWDRINRALNSGSIQSSSDLTHAISMYVEVGQDHEKNFDALIEFIESMNHEDRIFFFSYTLSWIIRFAFMLPENVKHPIFVLGTHTERTISLKQEQIACLLANGFLCTFPWQHWRDGYGSRFPYINFIHLFGATRNSVEKIKCLAHYFTVLARRKERGAAELQQKVLFHRRTGTLPAFPQRV